MPELHLPWLELSILTPLVGAIVVGFLRDGEVARKTCLGVCTLTLIFACGEWLDFGTLHTFEAHDHWDVMEPVLGPDILVVDELSAPLLPLAALLFLMTVLSTLRTKIHRFSFGWTLASETVLLATFCCRDPWAIIALLILATVPPWVELRSRGRRTRVYLIHMGLFAALLIVGQALLEIEIFGDANIMIAGALLTAAALLRSGIVPLHCWISDLLENATFGTALLFLTPMTGAYAVMRLVLPIAPDWALQSIAMVSLFTSVYAAAMSLVQTKPGDFSVICSLVTLRLSWWSGTGNADRVDRCALRLVVRRNVSSGIRPNTALHRIPHWTNLIKRVPRALRAYANACCIVLVDRPGVDWLPRHRWFHWHRIVGRRRRRRIPHDRHGGRDCRCLEWGGNLECLLSSLYGNTVHASISLRARPSERIAVMVLIALIIGGGLFPQWGVASRYHAAMALIGMRNNSNAQPSTTAELQLHATTDGPTAMAGLPRAQQNKNHSE